MIKLIKHIIKRLIEAEYIKWGIENGRSNSYDKRQYDSKVVQ
jgi:hypothetical protein